MATIGLPHDGRIISTKLQVWPYRGNTSCTEIGNEHVRYKNPVRTVRNDVDVHLVVRLNPVQVALVAVLLQVTRSVNRP